MNDGLALVIDQGTHATRTMAVDRDGRIRWAASADVSLSRLSDTHVEQDGGEILASVQKTLRRVLADAESPHLFTCAGLATQRSSVLAWDRKTGRALTPVISWQDRRVSRWVARFKDHEAEVMRRSGLPLSPHYGAGKLRWLFQHVPAVRAAHETGNLAWGPLVTFLLYHLLCGNPYQVDHANAQRTQLWNLHSRVWDPFLTRLFEVPSDTLPVCAPVCAPYGCLKVADIPMSAVSGDQNAAFFSLGRPGANTARVNVGTGAFVLMPTGGQPVSHDCLLSGLAVSFPQGAQYLLEGTVNGAGAALSWAAEQWGIDDMQARLPAWLARDADVAPVFVNAVGGLGSPWWRADATPRLVGQGAHWQRAVAVVESIVFLIQANLDTLVAAGCRIEQLEVTGGLARLDGLCQRLADVSHLPVFRPTLIEATVRGMAWLALGRPDHWPDPGCGRWFRPAPNATLTHRYHQFCSFIQHAGEAGFGKKLP